MTRCALTTNALEALVKIITHHNRANDWNARGANTNATTLSSCYSTGIPIRSHFRNCLSIQMTLDFISYLSYTLETKLMCQLPVPSETASGNIR